MNIDERRLADEEAIVWLEDIQSLAYVRQWQHTFRYRATAPSREVARSLGRMVGYSTVKATVSSTYPGMFTRRIFFLKKHDRDSQPEGVYKTGCPTEGVDPRTVRPGYRGDKPL